MEICICFQGVVEASITGDLKFRSNSQGWTGRFGFFNALKDSVCVALEVKGPLVRGARDEGDEMADLGSCDRNL
jgi:hypothetical protein